MMSSIAIGMQRWKNAIWCTIRSSNVTASCITIMNWYTNPLADLLITTHSFKVSYLSSMLSSFMHTRKQLLYYRRTNRIMSVQETKLEQEVLIFLFIIHTGGLGVPALKSAKDARVNQCHPLWITTATLINIWGLSTTIHSTFEM